MDYEVIGYVAGFLTTLSFLPQALKTIKAKNTQSISLLMYCLFTLGVSLWLAYGIAVNNYPVIIWNAITLPLSLIILLKKISNIIRRADAS